MSDRVVFHTNAGDVLIELFGEQAPKTVANFLAYVDNGFYDNTLFHRVIDGFVIQGGGFGPGMLEKETEAPIENEATNGLKNMALTLSMARTPDPHSASSQFFINLADNGFLDHTAPTPQGFGYCVFGRVVEGEDAIERIRKVQTGTYGFHRDVPQEDMLIEKAERVAAEASA